jgi:hypothetical protein
VITSFPTCPIPEIARLGRTLRAWRQQVLAYFDTAGVSNGGTEAINLLIEKTRRLAHGFRTFSHYRLRILLAHPASAPTEQAQPMHNSEEPGNGRDLERPPRCSDATGGHRGELDPTCAPEPAG